MESKKELKDFTNKELSDIITAFYRCKFCDTCPCNGVICGSSNSVSARASFALEVAKRLKS